EMRLSSPWVGRRSMGTHNPTSGVVPISRRRSLSLSQAAFSGKFQRFDSGTPCSGGVAIRHHVDGDAGLLLALRGHGYANLFDKPILELLARLQGASADDE